MKPVLITGGAGFIGTNLASRLLEKRQPVIVFDNLSRAGVEKNLSWLKATYGDLVEPVIGDVRDRAAVREVVREAGQVFHFAAQVAVTTSLDDPVEDFRVNAEGTLNVLEEIRKSATPPPLVFTSTNKVYGGLEDLEIEQQGARYLPTDQQARAYGISEQRPLDFHSPYGCSKGCADQYVIDYARTYGIHALVFRMSCIYGPHQCGTEDQGWVAHFLIQALKGRPITIYGDGRQVRDILFAEDLVDAFILAQKNMGRLSGRAFNIGGGAANAISLLELLKLIGQLNGAKPEATFGDWRPGDQRYYVTDHSRFSRETNWSPRFTSIAGIKALHGWLQENAATRPAAVLR